MKSHDSKSWLKQGKITAITSLSGIRLYNISSLLPKMTSQNAANTTITTTAATKKGSSMLGSLVSSKKKTLNGRNNSLAPDFQPMNSSATSAQVSTSNDRDLRPYWNGQVAEWSRKLWLPTMIDSASLPSTSSNMCSPSTLQNTWFSSTVRPPMSTNFPRISLRSKLSTSVECKEKELPYIDEYIKTGETSRKRKASATRARTKRKRSEGTLNRTLLVKVYPNHSQKQLLKRWIGLARFAYNSVVKWTLHDRSILKVLRIINELPNYNFPSDPFRPYAI